MGPKEMRVVVSGYYDLEYFNPYPVGSPNHNLYLLGEILAEKKLPLPMRLRCVYRGYITESHRFIVRNNGRTLTIHPLKFNMINAARMAASARKRPKRNNLANVGQTKQQLSTKN